MYVTELYSSHMKTTENARQLGLGNSFQLIQLPYQFPSSDEHQEHEKREWGCSTVSEQLK